MFAFTPVGSMLRHSRRKYAPGMSTLECWALVAGQRRDLADAVADLPGAAWDTPSLCAGWRVRDVVAHVVGNAEGTFTVRRALPGLLAHRFHVAHGCTTTRRRGAASPADWPPVFANRPGTPSSRRAASPPMCWPT